MDRYMMKSVQINERMDGQSDRKIHGMKGWINR